jgi:hypothetical protein
MYPRQAAPGSGAAPHDPVRRRLVAALSGPALVVLVGNSREHLGLCRDLDRVVGWFLGLDLGLGLVLGGRVQFRVGDGVGEMAPILIAHAP